MSLSPVFQIATTIPTTPLSDIEAGLSVNSPSSAILSLDTVMSSSGTATLVGGEIIIGTSGRYRIDAYAELLAVTNTISLQVNHIAIQSYVEGSIQNRPKPIIVDLIAGDNIRLVTTSAAIWLGGANNPATDTNYARILVQQLPSSTVIDPILHPVTTTPDAGLLDIGNVRIQWGTGVALNNLPLTTTFSQPYITLPVVTVTRTNAANSVEILALGTTTNTDFVVDPGPTLPISVSFNWMAIGKK